MAEHQERSSPCLSACSVVACTRASSREASLVGNSVGRRRFAAFGQLYPAGEVLALLALAASAAGVGVGVALGVLLFRRRRSLDTGALDGLKW